MTEQHFKSVHYCENDPGLSWTKDDFVTIDLDHHLSDYWALTPNVIKLPQGGYRMYYTAGSHSERDKGVLGYILSASSGDGISWRRDPMVRINVQESNRETWVLCPDVIPLAGGGWRMFFQVQTRDRPDMILSAFSADSLNWDREPFIKIGDSNYSYGSPRCVLLPNGTYRLYFHRFPTERSKLQERAILSAISSNGIEFTMEDGCRIQQETELEAGSVYAPEVLRLGSGQYRMYYAAWTKDLKHGRILSALSDDGLAFQKDHKICIDHGDQYDFAKASEPCVIQLNDGRFRLYYEACDAKGQWRIIAATANVNA